MPRGEPRGPGKNQGRTLDLSLGAWLWSELKLVRRPEQHSRDAKRCPGCEGLPSVFWNTLSHCSTMNGMKRT